MEHKKFAWPLLLASLLCLSTPTLAYELWGMLQRDNSVILCDNQGHVYYGYAEDEGDGTLNINVHDDSGITYSGIATETGQGKYNLDLANDNGGEATGLLKEK
jgi:hypothetical protein